MLLKLLLTILSAITCIFFIPASAEPMQVSLAQYSREKASHTNVYKRHRPRPQCSDRRDNDRDGFTDFPEDPGCRNRRDNSEFPRNRRPRRPALLVPTPTVAPRPIPEIGAGAGFNGGRPFPDDNPWNTDISKAETDPDSATLIASIGLDTGLHPDFGTLWEGAPIGIPYVVVSSAQKKEDVLFDYVDESDAGPYPIPDDPPIEGGAQSTGDRHVIIIERDSWQLYELYNFNRTGGRATAGSGAIFDLNSNKLRPAGWTSADAAGLPIFPGLVRFDEVMEQKEIRHALRFTAQRTRRAYVFPARHYASSYTNPSLPPMGMRVRLKASFDITPFPGPVQVILKALKRYGMFLADNGSNWFISGAPDARWDDELLSTLRNVHGRDFEVVKMGEIISD